jgi:hypothetical protein
MTPEEQIENAERMGLSLPQMLANVDKQAEQCGRFFVEAIKRSHTGWDGELDDYLTKAKAIQAVRRAVVERMFKMEKV